MWRDDVLRLALVVYRERGYLDTTLEQVAARVDTDVETLRSEFGDRDGLFGALMTAHSPLAALEQALVAAEGARAEDLLRDAMRRLVAVAEAHADYFELAVIDAQVNNGTHLAALSARLLPKALAFLGRLKATGDLRPFSDLVFGRTLVSLLIGYALSERVMPQIARTALRLLPGRVWLDGMVDLLLYGALEDDAR